MTSPTHALRDLWTRLTNSITRIGRRVFVFLRSGAARVLERWDSDHAFRRTVASAITAVTTTAIPNAALAAAVGAFLAERPTRNTRPVFDRFDYDDEDDQPWRPNRSSRLWDTLN